MRKVFISLALCLTALFAKGQCLSPTYIIDSDGYVNVRAAANSKSDIVARLASGTIVYVEHSKDGSKWCKVSVKKGGAPMGYIHTSRLAWDWPLRAYIEDSDGEFTNIRNTPGGEIILQLPTNNVYLVNLSDFQKGWWKIEELVLINENEEEVPYVIPTDTEYWVHTSCVNSGIRGDGTISFTLLSEPREGATVIKEYSAGTLPSILNIIDLSPSKFYLKVKLNDGNVGWIPTNIVCYSYFSICS